MEASELLKKIKHIEIKARGASKQLFSGQYKSTFKGQGMVFSEVRQYFPGDETRAIDWNVTARFNEPYIKTFDEERELTVMLLVDISSSSQFGTADSNKREYMAEIAAVLAYAAINNGDKVGLLLFSEEVELYLPPAKGKQQVLRMVREVLNAVPKGKLTNVAGALNYFTRAVKKRCTAFILSDFMAPNYTQALKLASSKHDVLVLKITDIAEKILPSLGWVYLTDMESGQGRWINTGDKNVQQAYLNFKNKQEFEFEQAVKRAGVDKVELTAEDNYIKALRKTFKLRSF